MKLFVLMIALVSFNNTFATRNTNFNLMSKAEQMEYIDDVAKDLRRDRWQSGYEDVTSAQSLVTKEWLDDYVKDSNNRRYENPLDSDEISELYKCFYGRTCQLYYVSIGSEYYGGYGQEGAFVLLYTDSKKIWTIEHVVYAE